MTWLMLLPSSVSARAADNELSNCRASQFKGNFTMRPRCSIMSASTNEMFTEQQKFIQQRVAFFGTLSAPLVTRKLSWDEYMRERALSDQAVSRPAKLQKK